ncbi:hypothetical protein SRHO_G00187110 [Serrasalmus rhombeus]
MVLAGAGVGPVVPRTAGEEGPTEDRVEDSIDLGAPATATASPGVARGPAPGSHPLAGKETPSISRPAKKSRKRRRAQDEETDKRQRAGSPGAAPEGAPLSPPVPPKSEETSVLVGDGTPPPPLIYGGREVPPNEDAYIDGLESVGGDQGGRERGSPLWAVMGWRALHERSAADSLFNARLQMAKENETCSAFFFQRVRQAREERCFTSLIDSEGRTCSDPARMMGIAHSFYSNLFSNRGTDREIGEHFLSFLKTSLPSAARDSLETPFSLGELTEVLGKMNRRKVPGLDGLPVEFYSTFWDVLGPEIVEVAEDVQGRLTESMRSGVLSLLYNKGDPKDLAKWRPLTMLCVDLKNFTKALTERLKKTMSLLVHSDQTCGVPGRSATWNLHLNRDAISWAGDRVRVRVRLTLTLTLTLCPSGAGEFRPGEGV